jgi:hypothetical protein
MLTNNLKELINEVKEEKRKIMRGKRIEETERRKRLGDKVFKVFTKYNSNDSP